MIIWLARSIRRSESEADLLLQPRRRKINPQEEPDLKGELALMEREASQGSPVSPQKEEVRLLCLGSSRLRRKGRELKLAEVTRRNSSSA